MNLLPKQLINDGAAALQVALGAGEYVKTPRGYAVQAKSGKQLQSITTDLIPIYDTFALNVRAAAGPTSTILLPNGKFILFDGNQQLTWQDGLVGAPVQQTIQKNDNWNNMSGTNGNVVGNNDAYAALGIYFEIHPFVSMQFENWLLKLLNPVLSIEVGARKVKRFTSKMIHYVNYNGLKGIDGLVDSTVGATSSPMRGLATRDELPTQMWNVPLVLQPSETIKIEVDFTNVAAAYTANYLLNVPELQAWHGGGTPTGTLFNNFLFISVGFFGLRGAKVA